MLSHFFWIKFEALFRNYNILNRTTYTDCFHFKVARQVPEYLVIIASRTDKNAASTINKTLNQENVKFLPLDLSSIAEVHSFAKSYIGGSYPPIQALILNAALQFPDGVEKTVDGFEKTFAISHIGNTLLFHLLYAQLAENARVVVVSSGTHDPAQKSGLPDAIYNSAEELAHPTPETERYAGRQRYATSKLCNVLWTYALHRRFARLTGKNLTVVSFDPGLMPGTDLVRNEQRKLLQFIWFYILPRVMPLLRILIHHNINTPSESGENMAWLAISSDVEGVSGKYYEKRKTIASSVDSYKEEKQEDLWKWTLENIATEEELQVGAFEIV